jgi:hypothetical protein
MAMQGVDNDSTLLKFRALVQKHAPHFLPRVVDVTGKSFADLQTALDEMLAMRTAERPVLWATRTTTNALAFVMQEGLLAGRADSSTGMMVHANDVGIWFGEDCMFFKGSFPAAMPILLRRLLGVDIPGDNADVCVVCQRTTAQIGVVVLDVCMDCGACCCMACWKRLGRVMERETGTSAVWQQVTPIPIASPGAATDAATDAATGAATGAAANVADRGMVRKIRLVPCPACEQPQRIDMITFESRVRCANDACANTGQQRLLTCGGCNVARYCNVVCQQADRARHKAACKAAKAAKAACKAANAACKAAKAACQRKQQQ